MQPQNPAQFMRQLVLRSGAAGYAIGKGAEYGARSLYSGGRYIYGKMRGKRGQSEVFGKKRARKRRSIKYGANFASRNKRTGGFLGVDLKALDCGFNGVTINYSSDAKNGEILPTSGCVATISSPGVGDTVSDRDGRRINIRNIFVTGNIIINAKTDQADPPTVPHFYCALVLDTQANGAVLNSEDVFTNTVASSLIADTPLRNLEYTDRFKIMASKRVFPKLALSSEDGAYTCSNTPSIVPVRLGWRGNLPVQFNSGTSADVGNVVDNAVHLIMYVSGGAWSASFYGHSRVRFYG